MPRKQHNLTLAVNTVALTERVFVVDTLVINETPNYCKYDEDRNDVRVNAPWEVLEVAAVSNSWLKAPSRIYRAEATTTRQAMHTTNIASWACHANRNQPARP